MTALFFDNSALSHFARADALDVLGSITVQYECVIIDEVAKELSRGIDRHPALGTLLSLPWLVIQELTTAHGTLWLVANGMRSGKLDRSAAEQIVDALYATGMRLPVDGAGFIDWAYAEGYLT